ncbi:MAG: SDR family oxidoreductase [bacterium]|nr:SDR family oxidoreductase [bacterium]
MSEDILDLKGRVALVTGAGQGVGRQVALHLAGHGAAGVVVNDVRLERAEEVAKEVEALGSRALPVAADVTDREAVDEMVARGSAELGAIGVLVNNAGNMGADASKLESKPFWDASPAAWDAFMGVNLYGVLNCTSAVIPGMIECGTGGRLITVISDAGRVGESNLEIYSAAKAGAAGFMRAVARSLGRHSITANCVAIGTTRTPTMAGVTENEELAKRVLRNYTIRRFGEPSDVANMVLFLASEASSWITGQTYPVNGGFSFSM